MVLAHAIDRVTQYGHQIKKALMRCILNCTRADSVGDGALGGSAEDMEEDVEGLQNLHGFETRLSMLHLTLK